MTFTPNTLAALPSYFGANVIPDQAPVFESDFSEKFDKAKNKVVYFCGLSAIFGVFTFEGAPSYSGVRLGELTDSRLEWILWIIASTLTINMIFRFVDERRRFEVYKNEVRTFQEEFSQVIGGFRENSNNLVRLLKDTSGDIRKAKGQFSAKVSSLKLEVAASELSDQLEKEALGELQYLQVRTVDEVERIQLRNRAAVEVVLAIPSKVEDFQRKNKTLDRFIGVGKIRLLLFDVFMPLGLYIIATLIHFIPNLSITILSLTG